MCSLQAKSHIKKFAFSDNREAAKSVAFTLSMYLISITLFPFVRGTVFRFALAFFGGMVNTRAFAVFHDCNHGKNTDRDFLLSKVSMTVRSIGNTSISTCKQCPCCDTIAPKN
jgi:fatty acid desaturase